jgi:outer membrane receptor for monomeric catechols
MPTGLLRTVAIAAAFFCNGAFAVASERPRHAPAVIQETTASPRSVDAITARPRAPKQRLARRPAADRDPYADPAAPYKANRLSWSPNQPILNIPGQTTVLTRQVLDDMKATSTRDALRSIAGVTVGR